MLYRNRGTKHPQSSEIPLVKNTFAWHIVLILKSLGIFLNELGIFINFIQSCSCSPRSKTTSKWYFIKLLSNFKNCFQHNYIKSHSCHKYYITISIEWTENVRQISYQGHIYISHLKPSPIMIVSIWAGVLDKYPMPTPQTRLYLWW